LEQSINEYLIRTANHLSLIFHRFINGSFSKSKVFKKINVLFNNELVSYLLKKDEPTNISKILIFPMNESLFLVIFNAKTSGNLSVI
jgi:hypothetical protein